MIDNAMSELSERRDVLHDASKRLARLAAENERLRAEANELRRRYAPGRHHRRVWQVTENARTILHYRHSGMDVSRRWLDATGIMSQRQYSWALAMLRFARVDVTPASLEHLDACLRRVDVAAERLLEAGDIAPLRARGNVRVRFGG